MEKDILDNNTGVVEGEDTIFYSPALLKLRNEYIFGKVQALYDSYGVKNSEELTSRIEGLSQAEEVDKEVSKIKKLREKYISAVFQLGIRSSLDPTAKYEEEVIWDAKKMRIGVFDFEIDLGNNIVVGDEKANLHILDKSNSYKPRKIAYPMKGRKGMDEGISFFKTDFENNILVKYNHSSSNLFLLNGSNDYTPEKIISTEEIKRGVTSFKPDLENNMLVKDFLGNICILDSTNDYKGTKIWRDNGMGSVVWDYKINLQNNIVVEDNMFNLHILNSSDGYKPTMVWTGELGIASFQSDLENNIVVLDGYKDLHFLDSSNDYRSTKIWSKKDIARNLVYFKFDLENNILAMDSNLRLHFLDSSKGYELTRAWDCISDFQVDLENNIIIADENGDINILDSSNRYEPTEIGSVNGLLNTSLDYEGNIIISSGSRELSSARTLSILRPKKG